MGFQHFFLLFEASRQNSFNLIVWNPAPRRTVWNRFERKIPKVLRRYWNQREHLHFWPIYVIRLFAYWALNAITIEIKRTSTKCCVCVFCLWWFWDEKSHHKASESVRFNNNNKKNRRIIQSNCSISFEVSVLYLSKGQKSISRLHSQ